MIRLHDSHRVAQRQPALPCPAKLALSSSPRWGGLFGSGNGDAEGVSAASRSENVSSRHRDDDGTGTTMLWVAARIRQAKVRKSKPGFSCSRSERIIGASQSAQNGRSRVALPWKNEGTDRFNMTLPLIRREAQRSQSPIAARSGGDQSRMTFRGPDWLVNIAHSQKFRAATKPRRTHLAAERFCVTNISSVGGGRCHIITSISKTAIGWWTRPG